eukprot:CAMPEP_0194134148 /NCGR_PEP_ID=MMETSP0152-20130528/4226_1 /TAXON_ID=1049557 /ORGANISM="Thalassiothrix antarctica, Strain L6-D1" /LENGTH=192 /DNA_ID=CAMNT_0038829741 /DNA_START=168 /DNA_END=746 /DNA_ORIENTATION=+
MIPDSKEMVNKHSMDDQTVKTFSTIDSFEDDDQVVSSNLSHIQKLSMNEDENLLLSAPWKIFDKSCATNEKNERNSTHIKLLPRRSKYHKAIGKSQNKLFLSEDTHFYPINLSDGSMSNPVSNFFPSNDNHSSPIFSYDEKTLENMACDAFLTPNYRSIENSLSCPQVATRSNTDIIQLPFCNESKLLLPML